MKRLLIAALALFPALTTMAQKADFSGKWKINLVRSEYGDSPPNSLAAKLNISQTKDSIHIERLWVNDDKESGYTEKFTNDGKPFERKIGEGRKMISTIAWSDDKKSLTETMKVMNGEEVAQTITQVSTLTDGGKSLKLDQTVSAGGQDFKMMIVYEK